MQVIAYTAVFGGYDKLKSSKYPAICLTDHTQKILGWETQQMLQAYDAKTANRWCKMHPHELFPFADATIYFDGNIQLMEDPAVLAEKYLVEHDIAVFSHPERDCVYDELEAVVRYHKANRQDVDVTKRYLKSQKFPKNRGLAACWVLIRNNCNQINLLNDVWWQLYQELPAKRDQLTFDYACWKLGIEYAKIPGNLFTGTSQEFKRSKHGR